MEVNGLCPGDCGTRLEEWPDDKIWHCEDRERFFCDNCHQTTGLHEHDDDYSDEDSEGYLWYCKDCSK